jgi:transposase
MGRRKFSEEYKRDAVRLVTNGGMSITKAASDLGLTAMVLSRWVRSYKEGGGEQGLTPAEKEELKALRKENAELRLERDILKKATEFFAKESSKTTNS